MGADLFLVLSKDGGRRSKETHGILSDLGCHCVLVTDTGHKTKWDRITKTIHPGAWMNAIHRLSLLKEIPNRVWFIEDDVQIHHREMSELIQWTVCNKPDSLCVPHIFNPRDHPWWLWWKDAAEYDEPLGALNQLCCLPRSLIQILTCMDSAKFHEVWFVNEAKKAGIDICCWRDEKCVSLFGPWCWMQISKPGPGLRHPVK